MAEVIVVGGGVGGMVAALLLARGGHQVRLHEKLGRLGGKLAERERDGFTFSLGPSLLTLPGLFRELGIEREFVRLDELCRYRFADGSRLCAFRDPARMAAEVDRLATGQGAAWQAFHGWARGCLAASERTFFAGPVGRPPDGARLGDLLAVAPGRTLHRLARRGHDLAGRLRFVEFFTPADLRDRYGAPGGAIYGTAYGGRTAPLRRPGNRGPRRGLYLVGGSTHPGGGLPMVAMSGRIVASLLEQDFAASGVSRAGRAGARR